MTEELSKLMDNWTDEIDENKMNRTQLEDENDTFDGQSIKLMGVWTAEIEEMTDGISEYKGQHDEFDRRYVRVGRTRFTN